MFDERAFISRVESANTTRLAYILTQHTAEEERALRTYFGDERYRRLRDLALKRGVTRGVTRKLKGNVIVIHGVMGSELSATTSDGAIEQIWAKILRLFAGKMELLRLKDDGRTSYTPGFNVAATGILKKYYGELLLSLAGDWNVRAFWFDWRKDLNLAADELNAQMSRWIGDDEPVHIVAHSMGGLVARTFIKRYPERWKTMWDKEGGGRAGGRLVMLGTPNHGSFAPVQVLTGLESMVVKLALVDAHHSLTELLEILTSFAGLYQMLPSPLLKETAHLKPLYKSATYDALKIPQSKFILFKTYSSLSVPQNHLTAALAHHEELQEVVDVKRMRYVAGYNQPTYADVASVGGSPQWEKLASKDGYRVTLEGDGRVPHVFGRLRDPKGDEVPMYYIEEEHGQLSTSSKVLSALDGMLENGDTDMFARTMPATRGGDRSPADEAVLARELIASEDAEALRVIDLLPRVRTRGADPNMKINVDERELEENLVRGYLAPRSLRGEARTPLPPAEIEIALINGKIEEAHANASDRRGPAVDAVAVGHYLSVKPQYAELMLDRAVSTALLGLDGPEKLREDDHLLTMYSERGILRGDLGQPFFLSDPRDLSRVIAIAGMGLPGHFGAPELTVLARELCWSLGRMGKRHLATIVIGAGQGNMPVGEAISAWIRGIKHAVTGAFEKTEQRIQRVTFVEYNQARLREIQEAILNEQSRLSNRLIIKYTPLGDAELKRLEVEKWEEEVESMRRAVKEGRPPGRERGALPSQRVATRVTLTAIEGGYSFSAITDTAAIPERKILVDPSLVREANDEIAGEGIAQMQLQRGQFLEQLIVPRELRAQMATNSPLVILLDRKTARIHWEMAAQSNLTFEDMPVSPTGRPVSGRDPADDSRYETGFLGTCRGLTRQLITTFAPPPEPPPPPRRIMRVLVVADPAADMPLKGAEEEGVEVADLFESFNRVYEHTSRNNRIEVVRLFGPQEAKRTNVLRHLMSRYYDVFHFAGHCAYDPVTPSNSGWIFTGGARLTANELNRIDRIPKFVFSNACESGVTPDESERRSDELAPSFAESFFARGVSNFVCTAWPVEDVAARLFALRLYSGLLGVRYAGIERGDCAKEETAGPSTKYSAQRPEQMYEAMQRARLLLAKDTGGRRTWGAYQHYGNPFLRFFNPASFNAADGGNNNNGTGGDAEPPPAAKKRAAKKSERGPKSGRERASKKAR